MQSMVEHVNISASDVDGAIKFFQTAMPDLRVRHDSGPGPKRWVHVGTDDSYIAIFQAREPTEPFERGKGPGFNHGGFVVEDADALHKRMTAAGYREGFVPEPHPYRKRVYFLNDDGLEFEFIQYYSDKPEEKNDYEL